MMDSNAKHARHSTLPWDMDSIDEGPEQGNFVLFGEDDDYPNETVIIATINGAISAGRNNAELIKAACNNYERVVEQRQELLEACEFVRDEIQNDSRSNSIALGRLFYVIAHANKQKAKEALAEIEQERSEANPKTKCRRCSECKGQEHHWLQDIDENDNPILICKHCEATMPYEDCEAGR